MFIVILILNVVCSFCENLFIIYSLLKKAFYLFSYKDFNPFIIKTHNPTN